MNIIFTIDKGYMMPLIVALTSLLKNNPNHECNIYVLHNGLEKSNQTRLDNLAIEYDTNILSLEINDIELKQFKTPAHFQSAIFYRLVMEQYIPENVHKILYLDADIIINADLQELYNTDISRHIIAAVENPNFIRHKELGMQPNSQYFNTGAMLINLDLWRSNQLGKKSIEFIQQNQNSLVNPDQDALNAILNEKWILLEPKYNLQTSFFSKALCGYSRDQVQYAIARPVIIHYTGPAKPWHFACKHPYKKLFWKYLQQSSYKEYKYQDMNFISFMKRILPVSVKKIIKRFM